MSTAATAATIDAEAILRDCGLADVGRHLGAGARQRALLSLVERVSPAFHLLEAFGLEATSDDSNTLQIAGDLSAAPESVRLLLGCGWSAWLCAIYRFVQISAEHAPALPLAFVPQSWLRGCQPGHVAPGFCTASGLRYARQHARAGVTIAAGMTTLALPSHPRTERWWVEIPGGLLFDGVSQQFFQAATYREYFGVEPTRRAVDPDILSAAIDRQLAVARRWALAWPDGGGTLATRQYDQMLPGTAGVHPGLGPLAGLGLETLFGAP